MKEIELSLDENYLKSWTIYDAIRELIQNAMDADEERWRLYYEPAEKKLYVQSHGATLTHNTLLLGKTQKNVKGKRGQFGEGYKIAALVLARAKKTMRIRTNDELWSFVIKSSEKFTGENTLHVQIKSLACSAGVTVEVENISVEEQAQCQNLYRMRARGEISHEGVTILKKAVVNRSRLYSGQMLISDKNRYYYDYDFAPNVLEMNRDRKIVNDAQVKAKLVYFWKEFCCESETGFNLFQELLRTNADDVTYVRVWYPLFEAEITKRLVANFKKSYGENAYPVEDARTQQQVEALGLHPISVSSAYANILLTQLPPLDKLKKKRLLEVKRKYKRSELTFDECYILTNSQKIAKLGFSQKGWDLEVVDFKNGSIRGMYVEHNEQVRVRVARSELYDVANVVRILIHEYAHFTEVEHGRAHEETQADIFTRIIEQLAKTHLPPKQISSTNEAKENSNYDEQTMETLNSYSHGPI